MYIIDGHNLLWALSKVSEELHNMSEAEMCRIIGDYLRIVGDRGYVVFDGTGPPEKDVFNCVSNLEVIFSGANTDADSIIETKIESDSAPKRLVVVSSDRRIRSAAGSRKAVSVKAEQFWQDMIKRLGKKKKIEEPAEKRRGLDPGQTRQWMKYFGFDE